MSDLNVPTKGCRGIDVGGVSYNADPSGVLRDVPEKHARAMRAAAECFPVSKTPRAPGTVCTVCGFRTWFKSCGRCGGPCVKEKADAGSE